MPIFTFVANASHVVGVFSFIGLVFLFHDLIVSSFCLYDETKQFALRRLCHSFVFFGGCPCSRCAACRRSHCCVEQPESMFERVVVRCQLLPVLVECRPSSPDSILDFGRLLLQERDRLAQISHTFSSCQYFEFYVIDFSFFFCVRALVAKNFRLSWMNPESHFFSTLLEFAQHF